MNLDKVGWLFVIIMCIGIILLLSRKRKEKFEKEKNVLVSYAYYEKNTERHNKNLEFFLKEGYERFKMFKNVDIYLCINGRKCNVQLPEETDNFKIIRRDNIGFDFGAHTDVINTVINKYGSLDKCPYDTYVFLNMSQRGPFLPVYWRPELHWSTVFSDKFKNAGLVGACSFYLNKDRPIVETWAFALRPDALKIAFEEGSIFTQHVSKSSAVDAETNLTYILLKNGLNYSDLQLKYSKNRNYKNINKYKISSRPWSYEDISINPLETIFYKTYWDSAEPNNNGYNCPFEQRYTEWILQSSTEYKKGVYPLYKLWNKESNFNKYYLLLFLTFLIGILCLKFRPNKNILFLILFLYLLIFYKTIKNKEYSYDIKDDLSLLVICKNESMVIDEFIEHYLWQGVDHIYLIDNGSTDNTKDIVSKYKQVSYYYRPERHKQTFHYNEIFNIIKNKTKWLIIADVDEYIYNRKKGNTIKDYLETLNYNKIAAIQMNWKMFGSNGHKKQPKNIRKSFTLRKYEFDENVKSIINTSLTDSLNIHTHTHTHTHSDKNIIKNPEELALNHYAIMSEEYFRNVKMTRGAADDPNMDNIRDMDYFNKYDFKDINDDELMSILD
jgi:hypothetical protein